MYQKNIVFVLCHAVKFTRGIFFQGGFLGMKQPGFRLENKFQCTMALSNSGVCVVVTSTEDSGTQEGKSFFQSVTGKRFGFSCNVMSHHQCQRIFALLNMVVDLEVVAPLKEHFVSNRGMSRMLCIFSISKANQGHKSCHCHRRKISSHC